MKALIVDDDVFVRRCMIQKLPWMELDFSQVLEASNGAEALEIALKEKIDLVITDVKMPQMTGMELAKRLNQAMVDICIILLSEHSDFSIAQQAIQCGVYDYILKPLTPERLEEINGKIRQAMDELSMRRYYTVLKVDNSSIKEIVREHLESSDAEALSDTFRYMALNSIHHNDLKRFGLTFLSELFDQAKDLTFAKEELANLRREALTNYSQIKKVTDLLAFVQETCPKCMALCATGPVISTPHARKMVKYIQTHYMDPDLSVAQVSDWMHLSPIYTGALFKKCEGKSIVSYIHEVRIDQAKKLLQDPGVSVKEVSIRVGYITPDYFTRLFNKMVGMAPSKYRAIILDKEGIE